ncbi:MAG: chain-length determining protein, partial [Mesorhizobium sp.]
VDARVFSRAVAPSEPYFPKILPITAAAFVGSLLLMAIVTLLQELFSGRAMRPAAGARFDRIEQVPMPVAHEPSNHEPADIEDLEDRTAEAQAEPQAAGAAPATAPATGEDVKSARPTLGEVEIDKAVEKLITTGAARAIFVSPEGDEAAASSVLVAREISDAGLRVLLLDLTASGAASRPMLDSGLFPGITNLLASEAQFSDVIHPDLYSDCHVIPVGTADPVRAMRAADRLPIIMQSLTTAYDLVVVECGPADAQGINRLVGEGTEVFLSLLEPNDEVAQAAVELIESGYPDLTLVTPVGYEKPGTPVPGRRSAA